MPAFNSQPTLSLRLKYCAFIAAFCACIFASFLSKASIDNVRFERFYVEDGLSQQSITSIFQDSDGFIWIGTQEGLNRYDGKGFKHFLPSFEESNSIVASWITDIEEDGEGNLWISTREGISRYNKATDSFTNYHADANEHGLNDLVVRKVLIDSKGNIWASTRKGINKYLPREDRFKAYNLTTSAGKSVDIFTMIEDASGALWLGSDLNGVYRFDSQSEEFELVLQASYPERSLKLGGIRDLYIDSKQRLWFAFATNPSFFINLSTHKQGDLIDDIVLVEGLQDRQTIAIFQDNNEVLWFATETALVYLDKTGSMGSFNHRIEDRYSISNDSVSAIHQDSSGVLWVGTFKGLNKWNTATSQFDHYRAIAGSDKSLSGNDITAIGSIDKEHIVIANLNGVDILNLNTNKVSPISVPREEGTTDLWYRVMSILQAEEGSVWLGSFFGGLYHYNMRTKEFKNYGIGERPTKNGQAAKSHGITSIYQENDRTLWLGTYGGGLYKFDLETKETKAYTHQQDDIYTLSSNRVMSIHQARDGTLWLGTWDGGISIFNPETESAFRIKVNAEDKTGLSVNLVWAIHEDRSGNIWVGTHGGGIHVLRHHNRDKAIIKFDRITRSDGLPSNVVFSIKEDEDGFIWVSSNQGLSKIEPNSLRLMNFTYAQGLQSNEFNSGSAFQMDDGRLFFGGSNGVSAFYPKDIGFNQHSPQAIVTAFQRLDKTNNIASELNDEQRIIAKYTDYLIGFEFASMHFIAPERNQYKYRLLGFEEDWVDNGNGNKATYTNLPAGDYVFEVISANSDGVWSEEPAQVKLTVQPAPWKSVYAYSLYALLSIAFIYFVYDAYRKKLIAETNNRQLLEREVDRRTHQLKEANEKLLRASITDQMTGLHNRRFLYDMIEDKSAKVYKQFMREKKQGAIDHHCGTRLFFMMFDLDGFKPINDNHGHDAGDIIIKQVALLLGKVARMNDTVIRWGGDEFLLVGECQSVEEVTALAEQVRSNIAQHSFDIGLSQRMHLSSSIGFALYPFSHHSPDSVTWEQAHILADNALYKSKDAGKNTWTGIVQGKHAVPFELLNSVVPQIESLIENGHADLVSFK